MRYIERTRYLEHLKRLKNTPDIKIITGLRRSGKSELMLAYIQELLRRSYGVYIGKLYQKEVDFIAQRGSDKIYIQVSDNISEKDTFLRETAPLLQIREAYPKMLLARTRHNEYLYEGIRVQDLPAWLLYE